MLLHHLYGHLSQRAYLMAVTGVKRTMKKYCALKTVSDNRLWQLYGEKCCITQC